MHRTLSPRLPESNSRHFCWVSNSNDSGQLAVGGAPPVSSRDSLSRMGGFPIELLTSTSAAEGIRFTVAGRYGKRPREDITEIPDRE